LKLKCIFTAAKNEKYSRLFVAKVKRSSGERIRLTTRLRALSARTIHHRSRKLCFMSSPKQIE